MKRIIILLIVLYQVILARELVVIGDKNFPEQNLTIEEIRTIFLDKRRFMDEKRLLVMNFEVKNSLRDCFEQHVLNKSKHSLERYWRKAYYQGKRPPKIIKSLAMLFSYLDNVSPSIGYSDMNATSENNVTVLYKVTCD